jgi:TonB family protein
MIHKTRIATFVLIATVSGAAQGRTQNEVPANPAAAAPSPAHIQRIVTKDPDYPKLLNPPQGNAFLQTYSKSYRDKAAEIQAKVGGINDENLQNHARNEEWVTAHKIDGDKFTYEADTAFREAKISFLRRHPDGWFEIGRVTYDQNNSVLAVIPNSTTPIDAALRVPMNLATLNQIYEKFHQIAAEEIDQKAHEYVSKAGAGSNCSRNPDWCFGYAKQDIEQTQRSERIVLVAQGDVEARRIDRLHLVDYNSETVLFEPDTSASALAAAVWRFSVGPVPAPPVEPLSSEARFLAEASAAPETLATPIKVPANVTAASIVTQTMPEYPEKARAGSIQGEVVLHAIIDKEGKISEVQVLSGDDVLAQSALQAVRQWRYKPMRVDGEAKEVDTTITLTFSLKD